MVVDIAHGDYGTGGGLRIECFEIVPGRGDFFSKRYPVGGEFSNFLGMEFVLVGRVGLEVGNADGMKRVVGFFQSVFGCPV